MFIVGGGDFEISRLLADVYDAYIMTGAILVDTHQVCQFALFRRAVGRTLVDYSLLTPTL